MPQARNRQKWLAWVGPKPRGLPAFAALVAATGSCSTMVGPSAELHTASVQIPIPDAANSLPAMLDQAAPPALVGTSALEANAALPLTTGFNPAASSLAFAPGSPVAQMRALDCLAQAIYYEARSEREEGQRAVAQVVLNRVRHPAWPNTVCGVVYQGALRLGGGCQFTFTCDGSLRFRPYGEDWARARRLASEALAGRVFEPVGLSTFYHANYVMPRWAPRLLKTAVIGAHLFYRLPGSGGLPAAFSARYEGFEPIARPNPIMVRSAREAPGAALPAWLAPPVLAGGRAGPSAPVAAAPTVTEPVEVENVQIRPEFRNSGQWRADAPSAITGR